MDFEPVEEDDFQSKLEEYNRNFDRLNSILGDKSLTDAGIVKTQRVEETKEILAASLPIAVEAIIDLASSASTESVRLRAAQILLNATLGTNPAIKADDPAQELIDRLTVEPDES